MKLFKKNTNLKIDDKNISDPDRITNLESQVNNLSHHLRLMARGYVILFVAIVLVFVISDHTLNKFDSEGEHTKKVQAEGAPTGVCLREGIKAGLPILVNFANDLESVKSKTPAAERPVVELFVSLTRKAEAPLEEYAKLQSHRYQGVVCPSPHK
jgi:hypothetical protein